MGLPLHLPLIGARTAVVCAPASVAATHTRRETAPVDDATFRLADGRCLAYRSWGTVGGPLVLAFCGTPGSRVWWPGAEHARQDGAHLVTVDRPGYGLSDPVPGRQLRGWADDVAELAAHLGVSRFGVVGWSGGAPFAAAVAAAMPHQLTGVCLVNSASLIYGLDQPTLDEEDQALVDQIEQLGRETATLRLAANQHEQAERALQDPQAFLEDDLKGLGEADLRTLQNDPTVAAGMADGFSEVFRQGAIGMVTDWVNHVPPWGFSLRDIKFPVHFWHGAQDAGVDTDVVRQLAAMIPGSQLTVWPEAGHLGLVEHWPEVLTSCLGNDQPNR
jgi:pimeloyl-ACP methyl ester carboxylesterase